MTTNNPVTDRAREAAEQICACYPLDMPEDQYSLTIRVQEDGSGRVHCDECGKPMSAVNMSRAEYLAPKPAAASHTTPDAEVERMGEALFVLSDFLRKVGAFESDHVHIQYENVVNRWNDLSAALATPAPSRDEVEREALESALRALAIDSTPIIRRLARIQIKAALNKDTGDE